MKRWVWLLVLVACEESKVVAPSAPPRAASSVTRWVAVRDAAGISMLEAAAEVRGDVVSNGAVDVPFAGRVVRVFVTVGDRIPQGAPVVAIIAPQVLSAAGAYLAASTRLEAQESRRKRLQELQGEGLTRAAEIIENEARIADAKAERATALATLRAAGVDAGAAGSLIERDGQIVLRSPIGGVVTTLDAAVGETREPGGAPIARIVGAGGRRVEAHLTFSPPSGASFSMVSRAGERVPLRLVNVSPAIDPLDGARLAWFDAPEGTELSVGAKERVRVSLESGIVLVPSTALVIDAGGTHVRRRDGWVDVRVVAASGADALVRGALATGDMVALDGQRVRDEERDAPEPAP